MRRFFISQLTRVLDFLKASESANAGTQSIIAEKIEAAVGPAEPMHGDSAENTQPSAFFPDKGSVSSQSPEPSDKQSKRSVKDYSIPIDPPDNQRGAWR